MVADLDDKASGFIEKEGGVITSGDRVRVQIEARQKDKEQYEAPTTQVVNNVGSGRTLGGAVEEALLGMAKSETKEIEVGQGALFVRATIQKIMKSEVTTIVNELQDDKDA